MNGADLVAQALRAHGVTIVSTLIGNGIDPVLIAAQHAGIRVVDTHNEQTAAYMAETYARFTARIGVCAVSSSVGFTNALIGVVNAGFDGAPILLISGASDHAFADRGNFQDFDQVAAAAPLCKYTRFVDQAAKIPFYVHQAIATATSGRPGPVHLAIPLDVLADDGGPGEPDHACSAGSVTLASRGDEKAIAGAAAAIARAERPLIVAGSGAFYAKADAALAALAARLDAPVVTPIWDRGSVTSSLPHFMGVIGAASGSPPLLTGADLIIMAGARVDYRVGYLQPPAVAPGVRIIRISADPGELHQGRSADVAIHADVRTALQQITALLPARPGAAQTAWLAAAQRHNGEFRARWRSPLAPSGRPAHARHIIEAVRPFVQGDTSFVIDGGNIGQWMHMTMHDRYPGYWMTCGASGVVGFGLGGVMAAKLAHPERPAILLSGDGSMGFNTADWEAAVRHSLPFVAIVADDQAWGIVVSGQKRRLAGGELVACQLGPIRFDRIAEACGALGLFVEEPSAIGPAIAKGLASGCPCLIQVPIAPGGPAD